MQKSLVIVESPAKAKTINKYLGKNFTVRASLGHIKNLPKNKLGVDIQNNFKPEYVLIKSKNKFINDIKKEARNSQDIYIATDPDREGEAIAWHIAQEINSKNGKIFRVLFNEITERAIKTGINKPGKIDLLKVDAQQARRIMDRIVGYQISPVLWKTLYSGLSAGRVQSVALRLISEREKQIKDFVSEEYWTIEALLKGEETPEFLSLLIRENDEKIAISDEENADKIITKLSSSTFKVTDIREKETKKFPSPPFITSSLQQEGVKRLGMSTSKIMRIAQQLYEGVELGTEGSTGLITYIRTDSVRTAEEAKDEVRKHILEKYGNDYLSRKPKIYKNKNKSQDAHEAIRPTSIEKTPENLKQFLSKDQWKLYKLIYNRFVASQMAEARIMQKSIDIEAGNFTFRTVGSTIIFKGFLELFDEIKEEKDKPEGEVNVPERIEKGQLLSLKKLLPKQHFTQPPPRYNESSLVKELDNLGIGRPSTYSLIISTLLERKYVERIKRTLHPTEIGLTVNNILVSCFPNIFNIRFTAKMEEELDKIETGNKDSLNVLKDFYKPLHNAIENYNENRYKIKKELQEQTDEKCSSCGAPMVIRWSSKGKFLGCSNFPKCKYTKPLEKTPERKTDENCPQCGAELIIKSGRYGDFFSCSRFPDCKFAKPLVIAKCPEEGCDGDIVARKSRGGRKFFACSNYPKCKFSSRYKIVNQKCPECGTQYLEERFDAQKNTFLKCPKCKHEIK